TSISLTGNSLAENQAVSTLVGTFSTADVDAGDTFTYAFCGGADDASFTISGNSLLSAVIFDYEAKNSYSICIRSTDSGGLSTTKTFVITITNLVDTTTFADVPMSYWAWSYIERLYAAGVTGGCGANPLIYCPESPVTRAQMAVFLLKGIHGSSYTPPAVANTGFTDVASDHWAAAWIAQLAAEGITSGCGNGMYCPENPVTRAQMAVFLLKAKHGSSYQPPAATGVFSDVSLGYWADRWIEQLAAEGITSGCGPGVYCPESDVTRAQMAVFLVKAFSLP
ncbi:MAG TPA: S-layer homology domain-containing protein, partial [Anaerolineales bacterium]|nr:S-layer homology domain-containing protein [Anaerolineales bacterium]